MSDINKNNVTNTSEKEEFVPSGKYENLIYSVYRNEYLSRMLKICGYALCFCVAYLFVFRASLLLVESASEVLNLFVVTGVPFVIVSIARKLINAKRPYEVYAFYDKPRHRRCGASFPSRHVFSSFVIGVALLPYSVFSGLAVMLMGGLIAVIRIALGVHFVRDVVAGALFGALSGAIGILILNLI